MLPENDEVDLPPLQQQAIEWLVRLRTHELSETETREFADWLSHDLSHAHAFANAEDLFDVMAQAAQIKTAEPTPAPKFAENTTIPSPSKHRPRRWLAVPFALAAAWLFAVTLVLPKQVNLWNAYFSDYHTGIGEQRSIRLADGSQLLLNTGTAVSVDYQDASRQIILHHGQAQFTVAADKARPFTVSAGELQVRALGTVFEVYLKASGDIDVAVQEHTVAASLTASGERLQKSAMPTLVRQGQQLRYAHGSGTLNLPETAASELTDAWQQRRVIVKDRPLVELVAEIERYHPGRIFLGDDNLSKLRVTGLFSMADPEASLANVRKILGLKETRLGPWWVLLHR